MNPNACAFDPNKLPVQQVTQSHPPIVATEVNKKLFEAMTGEKQA